jgi:inosine/xanthosine triphosphatase
MPMKIIVGSVSSRKIEVIERVARQFCEDNIEISGYPAQSGVPNTPYDNQTFEGAKNRALDSKNCGGEADFYIGLESGLVNRYGHMFEEAWACVIDANRQEYYGYSSGLKVPQYVIDKMAELKMEHCDAMHILEQENNNLRDSDTWHSYSGGIIAREISLEEAVRNVLIQVFAPEESFYRK